MSEVNKKPGSTGAEDKMDPRIDAIKEIIFGENIKEYNKEFDKLKVIITKHREDQQQKLKDLRQELKSLIAELDKSMSKQLADLKTQTLNELQNSNSNNISRKQLGELLEELGKKIQS